MKPQQTWTPAQWFEQAARCYVEGHQACPWCGGSHRVFRAERADRVHYHCNCCDFYVCYEPRTGRYHLVPGQQELSAAAPALGLA
jgi:hypothetical protein